MKTKIYGTQELARDFGPLTFGNALESYRQGEEITQKKFAHFLGMTPQSLCDLEKGRKIPSSGRAAQIAKKLREPVAFWVQLALQDTLRKEKLDLKVKGRSLRRADQELSGDGEKVPGRVFGEKVGQEPGTGPGDIQKPSAPLFR